MGNAPNIQSFTSKELFNFKCNLSATPVALLVPDVNTPTYGN